MAFVDYFTFSRPIEAPFVDAAGVTRTAAANVPRFDHSGPGRPLGLLVEAGGGVGQSDRARVIPSAWAALTETTVLHEWFDGTAIRRDGHYATDAAAMLNGCLGAAGHHRRIAVMPGYLKNYGGWVWALNVRWYLPAIVGDTDGKAIGPSAAIPLIGS